MRGSLYLVSPLDPATGSRVTIRAGTAQNSRTLRADGLTWVSAVSRAASISLDFFDVDYKGTVQFGTANFVLNAKRLVPLGFTKEYLASLIWVGAPISIWSGDYDTTAEMTIEFVGLVTAGVIDRSTWLLPLSCQVNKALIDVPLLNVEYGGGGGDDGDPEVRGTLKPAAFGKPFNVPVFFFDQTNWVGQVDGYGNVISIADLYEDAAAFGVANLVGDFATYAALVAANVPEGKWATCLAQGMIRIGADPKGVITCDPVCGYATPGTMMVRWLTAHAGVSAGNYNAQSFTDLDTALTALLGHAPAVSFWTQSQTSVLDRIQAMCAACNASPFQAPDGRITVTRAISAAAPAVTLQRLGGNPLVTGWRSLDTPEPWWRLKAEAAKTWRVHSLNEIDYEDDLVDMGDYSNTEEYRQGQIVRQPSDGIRYLYINAAPSTGHAPPNALYWDVYEDAVDATTVRYSNGVPVDALRPAEAGADTTGSHTAAAIVSQGALATSNQVNFGSSGRVYRDDGTTRVTDLIAVTALGTAAAIMSQGALATANTASWTTQVSSRPAELTDGRVAAGLDSFGDLARNISTTRRDLSNLLGRTGGGLFSGELAADVTSTHTAASITGQGALATVNSASWTTQVSGRPAELTDGRVAAGLDSLGDLARNITTTRRDASNLLGRAGGGSFTGELAADVTSTHTASAITGQGALATVNQVNLGASGRVYRDDGVTRLTDLLAITSLGTAAAITGQGALATLNAVAPSQMPMIEGANLALDSIFANGLTNGDPWNGQGLSGGTTPTLVVLPDADAAALAAPAAAKVDSAGAAASGRSRIRYNGALPAVGGSTFRMRSQMRFKAGFNGKVTCQFDCYDDTGTFLSGRSFNGPDYTSVAIGADTNLEVSGIIPALPAGAVTIRPFWQIQWGAGAPAGAALMAFPEIRKTQRFGDTVTREDGSTVVTDVLAITGLGTAASIAGQGSLATLNSAAWATQISGRPTELTDGRLAAGFDASGDLARNITTTRRDSSNLLGRTGGGLFSGELAADVTSTHTAAAITSQGALATLNQVNWGSSGRVYRDDGTTRVTDSLAITSLGTASAIASQGALATKNTANMDSDVVDGSTYARIKASELTTGLHKLTQAGSGARVGDQRNLPAISAMNLRYKVTKTSDGSTTNLLSYSSTAGSPATATITIVAVTIRIGSVSVAYNSMTTSSFTGTGGTTVTKHVYVDDAAYAGGTPAGGLQHVTDSTTSTTLFQADGRVYLGTIDVLFATSGTGGGTGGSGGSGTCLAEGQWALTTRGWVLAERVIPGKDWLRVLSLDGERYEWVLCDSNSAGWERCWRIRGVESGIEVIVSETSPITVLRPGGLDVVMLDEVNGLPLPFYQDGPSPKTWWEEVELAPAGLRRVRKIRCDGRTYIGGSVAGRGIATHNPKP